MKCFQVIGIFQLCKSGFHILHQQYLYFDQLMNQVTDVVVIQTVNSDQVYHS
ncbi:unnamed protein product [Schistosoma margrebowiei]|uniref:Uncharacterized protein n=1 Tax=Schistosoma margrebowiei TaxID=48269 RepID=A0A3P8DE36_9TREM|nr:unnamed protein product [Schistosoma margrebowiei]